MHDHLDNRVCRGRVLLITEAPTFRKVTLPLAYRVRRPTGCSAYRRGGVRVKVWLLRESWTYAERR